MLWARNDGEIGGGAGGVVFYVDLPSRHLRGAAEENTKPDFRPQTSVTTVVPAEMELRTAQTTSAKLLVL